MDHSSRRHWQPSCSDAISPPYVLRKALIKNMTAPRGFHNHCFVILYYNIQDPELTTTKPARGGRPVCEWRANHDHAVTWGENELGWPGALAAVCRLCAGCVVDVRPRVCARASGFRDA